MSEQESSSQTCDSSSATPSPPGVDKADLWAWGTTYLLLPLLPFIIGTMIRIVKQRGVGLNPFQPKELAFSLAMYCLVSAVFAERIDEASVKVSISNWFKAGTIIFISLFTWSVLEVTALASLQKIGMDVVLKGATGGGAWTTDEVQKLIYQQTLAQEIQDTLSIIMLIVFVLGIVFVWHGARSRHLYGLGKKR